MPFLNDPASAVMNVIVLLLSLTVHEFFHAWTAWKLGDDTAARMGRLTLNPIPHVDLFGTILLPLFGAPIGWAKPVPVDPSRFDRRIRMGTGDMLVSAAGPVSNLALGLFCAAVFGLLARFAPEVVRRGSGVDALLIRLMLVNAGLAIFNMLPIPPLDGGHVAANLVPLRFRDAWEQFARVGPLVLMGLIVAESISRFSILSSIIGPPRRLVIGLYELVVNGIAA